MQCVLPLLPLRVESGKAGKRRSSHEQWSRTFASVWYFTQETIESFCLTLSRLPVRSHCQPCSTLIPSG
jgi:hypothetical protein